MAARQGRRPVRATASPTPSSATCRCSTRSSSTIPARARRPSGARHAVIIDHLTPPMTTADAYGELAELKQLVDEYYQVELLDPSKMPLLQQQIWDADPAGQPRQRPRDTCSSGNAGPHPRVGRRRSPPRARRSRWPRCAASEVSHLIQEMDGYLCELAGAQIRDGLHILGRCPRASAGRPALAT